MTIPRYWLFCIALASTAMSSYWLLQISLANSNMVSIDQQQPDAFAENITIIETGKQGKAKHKMHAQRLQHIPAGNVSLLTKPTFTLYSSKENAWYITAENGKSSSGVDQLLLWNKVRVYQPPGENNKEATMLTETLNFDNKHQLAKTDAKVTMLSENNRVIGKGMEIAFKEKKLTLLSQVRGYYVPVQN